MQFHDVKNFKHVCNNLWQFLDYSYVKLHWLHFRIGHNGSEIVCYKICENYFPLTQN